MTTKTYPHVTGVFGDEGENASVLAVTAVLDPSPNWPECGRIIVGSPRQSPALPGYIANLGGFCAGVEGTRRLIATLQEAVVDVERSMGVQHEDLIDRALHLAERCTGTEFLYQVGHLIRQLVDHIRPPLPNAPVDLKLGDEQE